MIRSLSDFWHETMKIPEARWLVYGTILVCSVLIAVYVSGFFRKLALGNDDQSESELLTGFREMRDRGRLQEEEFKRLKQVMPEHAIPKPLRDARSAGSEADGNRSVGGESAGNTRTFLTLAEAESRKHRPDLESGSEQDRQETDSE